MTSELTVDCVTLTQVGNSPSDRQVDDPSARTDVNSLHLRLWRAASPDADKQSRLKEEAGREYLASRSGRETPTVLFNCTHYLSQLPAFARDSIDPLDHYLSVGWSVGLSPHLAFDSDFVAEQLGITKWTEPPLLAYFESPVEISPHSLFDVDVYSARVRLDRSGYARLFEMFLDAWDCARAPFSRLFSLFYYERAEPVVGLGRINPLVHYLSTEASRRRDANPMIHNRWYNEVYPAKTGQPRDPLVRFARIGLKQGHLPNPFAAREIKLLNPDDKVPSDTLLDYVDATPADRRAEGPFALIARPAGFDPRPVQTANNVPLARVMSGSQVMAAHA